MSYAGKLFLDIRSASNLHAYPERKHRARSLRSCLAVGCCPHSDVSWKLRR